MHNASPLGPLGVPIAAALAGLALFGASPAPAGDAVGHPAETRAAQAAHPAPQLTGYDLHLNKICGFLDASLRRTLQARNRADLLYHLRFDGHAQRMVLSQDLARIRLYASGAGVSVTARRPDRILYAFYGEAALRVRATRGGKVRIWATVDGQRTATRVIRVLPPRRECGT